MKIVINKDDVDNFIQGVVELAQNEQSRVSRSVEKEESKEAELFLKVYKYYQEYKDSLTMEEIVPGWDVQTLIGRIFSEDTCDIEDKDFSRISSLVNKLEADTILKETERECAVLVAQLALAGVSRVTTGGNHFVMDMILERMDIDAMEKKMLTPVEFAIVDDTWVINC